MEGAPKLNTNKAEINTGYKIEHLPGLDVIENLNYPNKADRDRIIEILKSNPINVNSYLQDLRGSVLRKVEDIKENGSQSFYVKKKKVYDNTVRFP